MYSTFFGECSSLKKRSYLSQWGIKEFHLSNFFSSNHIHCRVPDKEWSFQDGGLYIIKKVGVKILTIIVLYRLS